MIDIENEVFSRVSKALKGKFSSVYVTGEYAKTPPTFPAVSLIEMDNTAYEFTRDSGSNENHISVMYEANVYSNKKTGRKTECKSIISALDDEMMSLGFNRTFCEPIPNEDATIYRMTARYRAIVSKNKTIYNM